MYTKTSFSVSTPPQCQSQAVVFVVFMYICSKSLEKIVGIFFQIGTVAIPSRVSNSLLLNRFHSFCSLKFYILNTLLRR